MTTLAAISVTGDDSAPQAVLEFQSGWRNVQHGQLVRGGTLAIDYDPDRLVNCRRWFSGALFGDIDVHVRFHPSGQFFTGSVLEKMRSPNGGPVLDLKPARYQVTIPMDAAQVEIWFRNHYQTTETCEAWDSQYGRNYWFQVVEQSS